MRWDKQDEKVNEQVNALCCFFVEISHSLAVLHTNISKYQSSTFYSFSHSKRFFFAFSPTDLLSNSMICIILRLLYWLLYWLLSCSLEKMNWIWGSKSEDESGRKCKALQDLSTNLHMKKCWDHLKIMTDIERKIKRYKNNNRQA